MAVPPIPASPAMRYKAATPQAIDSLRNQLNSYNSQKKTNISQSTTVRGLTPAAPIVGIPAVMRPAKEDPISNIINQNPAPRQDIIVPGTKTTKGTTITEKKKTVKEVATDIQDPAGPNKPIGKSYREIHHKLEEDEEQLDELLSRRNPHKNTLGALERRETELIRKLSRPFAKKMPGRYFEEEQLDEMSAKEFIKLGKQNGHVEAGATGGHVFLVNPKTGVKTTIPAHKGDLPIGTARSIAKSLGMHIYHQLRSQRKLEEAITHNVVTGDTAWDIAKKYGVTLDALKSANPQVRNLSKIYAGKTVLNIPSAKAVSPSPTATPSTTPSGGATSTEFKLGTKKWAPDEAEIARLRNDLRASDSGKKYDFANSTVTDVVPKDLPVKQPKGPIGRGGQRGTTEPVRQSDIMPKLEPPIFAPQGPQGRGGQRGTGAPVRQAATGLTTQPKPIVPVPGKQNLPPNSTSDLQSKLKDFITRKQTAPQGPQGRGGPRGVATQMGYNAGQVADAVSAGVKAVDFLGKLFNPQPETKTIPSIRRVGQGTDAYMNSIREEVLKKMKRMKAEETVNKGGKTDTGVSGEAQSADRVTVNPEKDILKGQTR